MSIKGILCGLSLCLFSTGALAQEVTCESDVGKGIVSNDGGEIICASGMGVGWANGSEGGVVNPDGSGATDTDPAAPDVMPVETLTEEELLAMCNAELEANCGTEIPVPADVCTEDQLALCTEYVTRLQELETNCADVWYGDGVVTDRDGDVVAPDGTSSSDVDTAAAEPAPGGAEGDINPWMVADCCAMFSGSYSVPGDTGVGTEPGVSPDDPTMPEYDTDSSVDADPMPVDSSVEEPIAIEEPIVVEEPVDYWTDYVDCVLAVPADGCEALMDCGVAIYGSAADGDLAIMSADMEADRADDGSVNGSEVAPGTDTGATDSASDASCSFTASTTSFSVGSLLRVLFSF